MSDYCPCNSNYSVKRTTTTKPEKVVKSCRGVRITSTYSSQSCHATKCDSAKSSYYPDPLLLPIDRSIYKTPQFKIDKNYAFQIPAVASTNKFTILAPCSTTAAQTARVSKNATNITSNAAKTITPVGTQQKSVVVTKTVNAAVRTATNTIIENKSVSISSVTSETSATSASSANINITTAGNTKASNLVKIITPTPYVTVKQQTAVPIEEKSTVSVSSVPTNILGLEPTVTSTTSTILNVKETAETVEIDNENSTKINVPRDQKTPPKSITIIKSTKTPLADVRPAGKTTPADAQTPRTTINKFDDSFDLATANEEKSTSTASSAPTTKPVLEPTTTSTTPSTLDVKKTAETVQIADNKSPKINVGGDQKTPKAIDLIKAQRTSLAATTPKTPTTQITKDSSSLAMNLASRLTALFCVFVFTEGFNLIKYVNETIIRSVIIMVKSTVVNMIFGYASDTKFNDPSDSAATIENKTAAIEEKSTGTASSASTTKPVLEPTVTSPTSSTSNIKKTAETAQIADKKSPKTNIGGDKKTPKVVALIKATKTSLSALCSAGKTTPRTPITNGNSSVAMNLASRLTTQFSALVFTEEFNLIEYVNETMIGSVITMFKSTIVDEIVGYAGDAKFDDPFDMDSSYEYWRI